MEKGVLRQICVTIIVTLGALVMGTILGWSSSAQGLLPKVAEFTVSEQDTQTYSSVFGLGAVFGALTAGKIINMIGRRYGMMLSEIFVMTGWILLSLPKDLWMMIGGRVSQGIGIGALCTIIPGYVGEISLQKFRGGLLAMFQVFVVSGILYSYVFGSILQYIEFNAVCGMWCVIHLIGVCFVPESPYYLMSKNKDDKANASLKKLRGGAEVDVTQELNVIKNEVDKTRNQLANFKTTWSDKANRKALIICAGCMFFQQTSGVNAIIFYMNYLFKLAGSKLSPETSSIIVGIVQFVITFISLAIIDKVGRRILLIISAFMMGLSLAGLAGCFIMIDNHVNSSIIEWLPLSLIALYITAFSLGFGPVPWVVSGEIFSSEAKPYGSSVGTAVNWIMVFVVTFLPNIMTKLMGTHGLFITYTIFCLLGALFVIMYIPETKNKSFAEIQSELAGKQ